MRTLIAWFHRNFDIVEDPHTRDIRANYRQTRRDKRARPLVVTNTIRQHYPDA